MSYIVQKHISYTEEYEIKNVKRNLTTIHALNASQKNVTDCGLCDTTFKNNDDINLAFVENKENILICETCTVKAIEHGAQEVFW